MDLCNDCSRLSATAGRPDEVRHLTRVGILKRDSKVTFRYQCEACAAEWDWTRGAGWHLQNETPAPPLISRLFAAARSRFTHPH